MTNESGDRDMKNKTRTLIAAVALIALSACSSNGKILGQYSVKGEGATTLNRDTSGKSLSVVIRIFQLRDANEFSKLTFDTLAAGYPESELLGTSLLDKTDVVLVPGGTYTSIEKLHEDTRFIGIVGLFRNPDPHHWRQLVETRDTNGNRIGGLTFLAHDCHLAVVGSRSLLLPGQPPQPTGDCGLSNMSSLSAARPIPSNTTYERRARPGRVPAQTSSRHSSVPEISVTTPIATVPTNVRFGGTGGSTVTVGTPSPPAYYSPPGTYTPSPTPR